MVLSTFERFHQYVLEVFSGATAPWVVENFDKITGIISLVMTCLVFALALFLVWQFLRIIYDLLFRRR